jgi:hypothetical protein
MKSGNDEQTGVKSQESLRTQTNTAENSAAHVLQTRIAPIRDQAARGGGETTSKLIGIMFFPFRDHSMQDWYVCQKEHMTTKQSARVDALFLCVYVGAS